MTALLADLARSTDARLQAVARAARPDYQAWLSHVKPAAACTRPIRLAGTMLTIDGAASRILDERHTTDMPDGVIYKPCGNRRESVCPSCSERYKRDAYQIVRAGLVGGKGIPEDVAAHPAVFPTFTAPSFGEVHTRNVKKHTCLRRIDCDCRAEPCHARRDFSVCPHRVKLVCFARHAADDRNLGSPLCLDCYDYDAQAIWNLHAGELWRRTSIAVDRYLHRLARERGIPDVPVVTYDKNGKRRVRWASPVRLEFGKAAEMQRRAAIHLHCSARLDGFDPEQDGIVAPPPGFTADDLKAGIENAVASVVFTTKPHPANPAGWPISWGDQVLVKVITDGDDGEVTHTQVAAYLAKYSTKSTEVTGHTSNRLTDETIGIFADPDGTHPQRLVDACWRLGNFRTNPEPPGPLSRIRRADPASAEPFGLLRTDPECGGCTRYRVCPTCAAEQVAAADAAHRAPAGPPASPYFKLRRWAHMLGFGGHFLTKSRRYSITFGMLREQRIVFRRNESSGPELDATGTSAPTTLVVNFLEFVGAGWQTPADAMLANTSAQMAREHQETAREYLHTRAA